MRGIRGRGAVCLLVTVVAGLASAAASARRSVGAAASASSLPTLNIALHGASGVSVSGSEVSGAVNVVVTFQGSASHGGNGPGFALVRLNPGATLRQALGATGAAHGDLNALTPYGSILVSGGPGSAQAVLTPGNWVAVNTTSGGQPVVSPFTVTQSSAPAALPAANATENAIEFGFRGPTTIHDGTVLREVNGGWLVHMVQFIGVKNRAMGEKAMGLLREGKDKLAQRYVLPTVFGMGPVSHGGMQQATVTAKPGYYIEACFMDTEDGREHTRLGMLRLVKVVG